MTTKQQVRVRFAPSPTGYLHLGNIRSALFNYLYARKCDGAFLIRIEDTDLKRNIQDSDRDILEVLSWLGLHWNEGPKVGGAYGPYYQSQRLESYRRYADSLIDQGKAYYDFSTSIKTEEEVSQITEIQWQSPDADLDPAEAKARVEAGETYCVRMRIDTKRYKERRVSFADAVRGEIVKDVEDFVIIKQDGMPTYHFGVVIDDHNMKISHVIRGFGHLDNTAKHAVLYDAFGWERPVWAHHSNTSGLSKRKGSPSIGDYMRAGYLPEAIGNMCLLMGWFPKDREELFRWEDRMAEFDIKDLSPADAGKFDADKFEHICRHHMAQIEPTRLLNLARPFLELTGFIQPGEGRAPADPTREKLLWLMGWVRERVSHAAAIPGELWAFGKGVEFDAESTELLGQELTRTALRCSRAALEEVCPAGESMTKDAWKKITKAATKLDEAKEHKIKGKNLFHPLRAALTGRLKGPELGDVAEYVGREEVLARLDRALEM